MSKLLYIHKPSLTAIVQYNPHPDVEKIATVDMLAVAERVIEGKTSPMGSQPYAILACLIKRLMKVKGVTIGDSTPEGMALWFIENHPQALDECSFRRQGNNNYDACTIDEREIS
jgi:hypothetical protein